MSTDASGFENFLFWLGAIVFAWFVAWFLSECFFGIERYVWPKCAPSTDLAAKYGKWAVVTGSTDGIGKAYAMELAEKGMNVCLISRSQSKLINVSNEIKSLYPVSVKWIKADFNSTFHYDYIEKELSDIDDIGILVNNVGIAPDVFQPFCNNDWNLHSSLVNINISSMVMMTLIVLKKMIPKDKGLIVNMGSMSSIYPLPYGSVYSSTKKFVDNFSLCLAAELVHTKIQVHCLRPGFTRTNLLANMKPLLRFHDKVAPFLLPDVNSFSRSAVRMLNVTVPLYTCGYWTHSLLVVLEAESNETIAGSITLMLLDLSQLLCRIYEISSWQKGITNTSTFNSKMLGIVTATNPLSSKIVTGAKWINNKPMYNYYSVIFIFIIFDRIK